MKNSRCIIVLGVVGSGTSAVAGTLDTLGVSMGERLVGAGKSTNPRGHFEDRDVRIWLNNITRAADADSAAADVAALEDYVLDRAARYRIWGLKDPRLAGQLDLIVDAIGPDWRMVCVDRDEAATARSLAVKWNRSDIDRIIRTQNGTRRRRAALLERHKPPVLWIDFNDLTRDPVRHVNMLHDFAFEDMDKPSPARIRQAIDFIDPSLNHHRESQAHG